jgi:hypothetical protein
LPELRGRSRSENFRRGFDMGTSIRFLLRGKIASAIEAGVMAAVLTVSVAAGDVPAGTDTSLARPASSPGCDVICDGWLNSSQP